MQLRLEITEFSILYRLNTSVSVWDNVWFFIRSFCSFPSSFPFSFIVRNNNVLEFEIDEKYGYGSESEECVAAAASAVIA